MGEVHLSRAARVVARCWELARLTMIPGEITRPFLSPAARDAHTLVGWWMRQAGMSVRVDAIGNLRGLRPATDDGAPTLLLFSHLDTEPGAGALDGVLGVVLAICVVEELAGEPLPFAVEVVFFNEGERARFGLPFLTSRATVGELTPDDLERTDAAGLSLRNALRDFGLEPNDLGTSCALRPKTHAALEIHVEQGPVLDGEGFSLGIVEAVAGQSRLQLTFTGQANDAGAMPMALRRDALAAAALWTVEVERFALGYKQLVATVGQIEVLPGAAHVVPGRVRLSLDVRHPADESRHAAVARLLTRAEHLAAGRGVRVQAQVLLEHAAVPLSGPLADGLEAAAEIAGYPAMRMFSGAGHNAMILAPHVPTALLFVRSPDSLTDHPDEAVNEADVEAALATVLELVQRLRL